MRKTAIFEDVVSIMTQDSATKKDLSVRIRLVFANVFQTI